MIGIKNIRKFCWVCALWYYLF